jgi:hypothetical protein
LLSFERSFLAFVLGLSSLGVRRNLLEGLFFGKVVLYTIGRFTTREWLMLLHEIVSVFSSKLLE